MKPEDERHELVVHDKTTGEKFIVISSRDASWIVEDIERFESDMLELLSDVEELRSEQ